VPIYEYLCQGCAYKFELKQSMKDEPATTCERCGKTVNRIISSPAIMFKGSGWYVTDYSDKMKPPSGESSESLPDAKKDGSTSASPAPAAPAPAAAATPSANGAASPASTTSSPSSSSSSGNSSSSST
jgi:putative FmdB family regulatory protein